MYRHYIAHLVTRELGCMCVCMILLQGGLLKSEFSLVVFI